MAKLYANNGSWRTIKVLAVKAASTWRYIRTGWIKKDGVWEVFYGGNSGTDTFSVGTTSWIIPDGVFSITVTGCGGGAGGGGSDAGANYNGNGGGGGGSNLITSVYAVTPSEVLTITVGAGGAGGIPYGSGGVGGTTAVAGTGVSFSSNGGGADNGYVLGTGISGLAGLGANGANYNPRIRTTAAGLSTNGGSNGGTGGVRGNGSAGQAGKLTITY